MHIDPHFAAVIHHNRATEMQEVAKRARLISDRLPETGSNALWKNLSALAKKVKPHGGRRTTERATLHTGTC